MLNSFNSLIAALPPDQRQPHYLRLAHDALAAYNLAAVTPLFVQHNAGITFRIDVHTMPRFLLKLHVPAGDSLPVAPANLHARLQWLQDIGQATTLVLPVPIANRAGALLTSIGVAGLTDPVCKPRHMIWALRQSP